MAVQPSLPKPNQPMRPMMPPPAQTPIWVPLMMVFVTVIALAALGLSVVKNAPAQTAEAAPKVNLPGLENKNVEEGHEVEFKITELEKKLSLANSEIRRLNEELIQVRASVDGLNTNVSIVQAQSAKTSLPVNVQNSQPELNRKN